MLEIETDKASVEIEALESGMLQKIVAGPGEEIPVGAVIGYLLKAGETAVQFRKLHRHRSASPCQSFPVQPASLDADPSRSVRHEGESQSGRRKLAKSLGVDLARAKGSGPDGRVVAWNVTDLRKSCDKALST